MNVVVPDTNVGIDLSPELLQDLINWSLLGAHPPAPDFIKKMTILQYAKAFSSASFIETGTFTGTTLRLMADLGLQCKSVELAEHHYRAAKQNFAGYANVELFFGDSGVELSTMVERATGPHLFWLDGHYSRGNTARGAVDTPIVQELNQLLRYDMSGSVVLIDDMRDFGKGEYPPVAYLESFVTTHMSGHVCENFGDIFRITPKVTLAGKASLGRALDAA